MARTKRTPKRQKNADMIRKLKRVNRLLVRDLNAALAKLAILEQTRNP